MAGRRRKGGMAGRRKKGGGSGEGTSGAPRRPSTGRYHRHTPQQIQRLEGIFAECRHPSEAMRLELSNELGMSPSQIKFWFQNKRTQMKVKNEKEKNIAFRADNDRARGEINEMAEVLENLECRSCGNSCKFGEEIFIEQQNLRAENAYLKGEIQRLSREAGMAFALHHAPGNSSAIADTDKAFMVELAHNAMEEFNILLQSNELWMNSSLNGRAVINLQAYERRFLRGPSSPNVRTESSKDCAVVFMNSLDLVGVFMDANKCMEIFPTIVSKARTIAVIKDGLMGSQNNLLQLMYEELNVLSPLVQTRKFYFLRFCKQLGKNSWAIVDVSYDNPPEFSDSQSQVRRLPSGCYIQGLPDGQSKVTWMEHTRIEDGLPIHDFYREHIYSGLAFGAQRRLAILKRMCERINCLVDDSAPFSYLGLVNPSIQGRRNLMKLSQMMITRFCSRINPDDGQQITISKINDIEVHTSLRKCPDLGHPDGTILSAAATTWLPFTPLRIFNFLRDVKYRPQWDVITDYGSVREAGRMGFLPGNCITILEAFSNGENKLILQESWADPSGALVVYCPLPLPVLNTVMIGEDPSFLSLSPSGFAISRAMSGGALVTFLLQMSDNNATSGNMSQESVNLLNTCVGITIDHLKAALS